MIRRPATILALLTGLNLLNYLDRYVMSAVLPEVQKPTELGLSNFKGGLLFTVFLVGYMLTAPAFGALGDRMPRKHLIALGIVLWSLATMASGFATGEKSLFAARAMVGVGEASYATLAPTIIDDITPSERKGRALSIFYIATPVGSALGYLVGGFVAHRWGWRSAFWVAGGPGILLALVCLFIEEPQRKMEDKPDILRDLKKLLRVPLYVQGVLGYCASTAAVGAFSAWAPKYLVARYNVDLDVANFKFGVITVIAGAIGTIIGGRWADSPSTQSKGTNGLLRICAVGGLCGAPFALGCFVAPSANLFFVSVFFAILFIFLNTSPINAVVLSAVPVEVRAGAMALSILAIHVLGDVWSPPFVGLLADHMPIQYAMMALPLMVVSSGALWWPRRRAAVGTGSG